VAVGVPHHVTQRGNNRQQSFFSNLDRRLYMTLLRDQAERHGLSVLGWCLMPNHVHIVGIPEHEQSLARALGRAHYEYTIYLNRKRMRSGHLWQNRFFSTPLDRDHLHTALRYVDLNPVRGGLVTRAVEYPWSSAEAHVSGRDEWGVLDRKDWRRISTRGDWQDALREGRMEAGEMTRLQRATQTGRPLGSDRFVEELEAKLQRPLKRRKTGPAKRTRAVAPG